MALELYEIVKEMIGVLPPEMQWAYGVATIILFSIILGCVVFPFAIIYKWVK